MPQRIPTKSIVVHRGTREVSVPHPLTGELVKQKKPVRVNPQIGVPFDFTQEEVEFLNQHSPGSIRKIINEGAPQAAPRETAEERDARLEREEAAAAADRETAEQDAAAAAATGNDASDL